MPVKAVYGPFNKPSARLRVKRIALYAHRTTNGTYIRHRLLSVGGPQRHEILGPCTRYTCASRTRTRIYKVFNSARPVDGSSPRRNGGGYANGFQSSRFLGRFFFFILLLYEFGFRFIFRLNIRPRSRPEEKNK